MGVAVEPVFIKSVESRLDDVWGGGGVCCHALQGVQQPAAAIGTTAIAATTTTTDSPHCTQTAPEAPPAAAPTAVPQPRETTPTQKVRAAPSTMRAVEAARLAQQTLLSPLSRRLNVPSLAVREEAMEREKVVPVAGRAHRFVKALQRGELTALATLVSPWLPPPRQFSIDLTNIDLHWIVLKKNVPTLSLASMPEDVSHLGGTPPYLTPSGNPVLINSPRSVVVLLRFGISPERLQKRTGFKCELEKRHAEGRRIKLLQELQRNYRQMCSSVSAQEINFFFEAYNPAGPGLVPDLDLEGEMEVLMQRMQPSLNSGSGLYSETDVCYTTLAHSLKKGRRSTSGSCSSVCDALAALQRADTNMRLKEATNAPASPVVPDAASLSAEAAPEEQQPAGLLEVACEDRGDADAEEDADPAGASKRVQFVCDDADDASMASTAGGYDNYADLGATTRGSTPNSRRAQQESHDPVFHATRLANMAKKMDLRPLIRKMERTRIKMESILVQDTEKRLQKVCDVKKEQERKMVNLRNHEQRLQRVQERQRQTRAERQERNLQQQVRREHCARDLQRYKDEQLQEKELKERSLLKRKDAASFELAMRRKKRRDVTKINLEEKQAAAKALDAQRIEYNLRLIDDKEVICKRVESRREAMQSALKEAGVAKRNEALAARERIEEHFKQQELERESVYNHKIHESERRIAALSARKVLLRNTKAEMECRAETNRAKRRAAAKAVENAEHLKAEEEAAERASRFEMRKSEIAVNKSEDAIKRRLRMEDSREHGVRLRAVSEFENVLTHGTAQRNTDRVNTLMMQVGIIKEKTRRAREDIYVEKESRMRVLNDLSVKAEKKIYCDTWNGFE